jgi:choline dehydrogenase-like flavoprotein
VTHPALSQDWDVIVIGTGMGGGTIGRALAEKGMRVLFLEKGRAGQRRAENGLSETFVPEARLARGLWPEPLHVNIDGADQSFYAPLGAGVGGSSVFYAATLERPERHDLDDRPDRPHPTSGWPIGYDAMLPWYAKAADQYQVYGTKDPLSCDTPLPLRDPPALNSTEQALMDGLSATGLHPYHAHTALAHLPDCRKCLGHKCPRTCKMDGRSAGVEPALATGRAALVEQANVIRLIADATRVTGVDIQTPDGIQSIAAKRVVLAGGLSSPRVMLASASAYWPDGLANHSGLVGRNLMFHLNEMFALWPKAGDAQDGATKAISLRDFYHHAGSRFGTVQAMGIRVSYGEIVHYLNLMLARTPFGRFSMLRHLTRLPAAMAERLFGHAQIFVGLMEDLPYPENRVLHDSENPDRLAIEYRFAPELLERRRAFRKAIRKGLRGHRMAFLGLLPDLNYGHPCGTLRFGHDPQSAVLDADCRAHGLVNLWVADASFMPTSMGVNPSLTIAANALRVADCITRDIP